MMDWPVILKQKVCPVKKTSETHTHAVDQLVLTLLEILYTSASKRKRINST